MDKKVLELAEMRREFSSVGIDERALPSDPLELFSGWMQAAINADVRDPNAMSVSTVGSDGKPSIRIVLLKNFDTEGFTFFTNYTSKKAEDLSTTPATVFHFFWPQLDRQVAVYGSVEKTSREESEKYFLSRPLESRLSAWASHQSSVVSSRAELEERVEELRERFGEDVPPPPFWGGFRLRPERYEFWQGRQNRLHDRIIYSLEGSDWVLSRLAP